MNERLKKLRKKLDITQQEFADRIGIKRNSFANYETGRNKPIDAIIKSICREFNVNEEWLRTGIGEMFIEEDFFSLDDYAKSNNLTDIEKKLILGFMKLDPKVREAVYSVFKNAFSEQNPEPNNIYDEAPDTVEELERLYPPIDIKKLRSKARWLPPWIYVI